ncbi:MAG: GNAT family N-acetyltransferase [Treponemataceae bacterium]
MNKVRKAVAADATAILDVYNDGNGVFGWPPQDIKSTFEEQIENDIVFIMEENNQPIAFISFKPILEGPAHIFIEGLYVLKEKQRSGAGSKLLAYVEQEIEKADAFQKIVLKTLKSCLWVETFYKKNGYEVLNSKRDDAILDSYFPPESFETVMFKNI